MAMTNEEATAVNGLVMWLLGEANPLGAKVDTVEARNAAEFLVDHANQKLMAGLRPQQVLDKWPRPNSAGEYVFTTGG